MLFNEPFDDAYNTLGLICKINWSYILPIHRIFFHIRLYLGPTVLIKLLLESKGIFPRYPRRKLFLLVFLLLSVHATNGPTLVLAFLVR